MVFNYKDEIGIEEVVEDLVILKDNSSFIIIEVEPIDYDNLSLKKKEKVDLDYQIFFNNLEFPIQIVSRAVNFNYKEEALVFKNNLEFEIKKKDIQKELLKLYDSFISFFDKHLKNLESKNLYYIVVPVDLGQKLFKKAPFKKKEKTIFFNQNRELLNDRFEYIKDSFSKIGLNVKKLNSNEILELYSSYFEFYIYDEKKKNYIIKSEIINLWEENKK